MVIDEVFHFGKWGIEFEFCRSDLNRLLTWRFPEIGKCKEKRIQLITGKNTVV